MKFYSAAIVFGLALGTQSFANLPEDVNPAVPSDVTSYATVVVTSPLSVISSTTDTSPELTDKEREIVNAAADDAFGFLKGGEKTPALERAFYVARRYKNHYHLAFVDNPSDKQLAEIVVDLATQ